jgi:branched-chain amino acid transport system substrate-binding protein
MLLEAIKRSGPDPQKLRDAIENTSNFHGITNIPPKPFTPTDHDALHADNIEVGVVKNASVVLP